MITYLDSEVALINSRLYTKTPLPPFDFVAGPAALLDVAPLDSGLQDAQRTTDAPHARPQDTPAESSRGTRSRSRGRTRKRSFPNLTEMNMIGKIYPLTVMNLS